MPVISDIPIIEAHAAPIANTISPEAIYQNILGAREVAEARAAEARAAEAEVRAIEWKPESDETPDSQRTRLMREISSLIVAFTILVALTSPLT